MYSSADENVVARGSPNLVLHFRWEQQLSVLYFSVCALWNTATVSSKNWLYLCLQAKTCMLARNTYTFPKTQTWYAKEHCASFGRNLRDHLGQRFSNEDLKTLKPQVDALRGRETTQCFPSMTGVSCRRTHSFVLTILRTDLSTGCIWTEYYCQSLKATF